MISGLQWNAKAIGVTLVTAIVVLYAGYNMWHSHGSVPGQKGAVDGAVSRTGKAPAPVSVKGLQIGRAVPIDITQKSAVKIEEKKIKIKIGKSEWNVFYREAAGGDRVPLVLLHGAAFTSQNWVDIGTIQLAASMGHHVIAVDLPSPAKGKTMGSGAPAEGSARGQFLDVLLGALGVAHPILVSPSMSGSYALPLIMCEACTHTPAGYIPVAPVNTGHYEKAQYKKSNIPVLIVYGEKDENLGATSAVHLAHFANSLTHVIKGAGHPAYIHKPDEWTRLLYNFLMLFDKK